MSTSKWYRFHPQSAPFFVMACLMLFPGAAHATDPPPITIECDKPSIMINKIIAIKKNDPHKLTFAKEMKPTWNIVNNEIKVQGKKEKVVDFPDGSKNNPEKLTGKYLTDLNRPNPDPLPVITATTDDKSKSDTVSIQVVDAATAFVPAKILANKTKQDVNRKNDKYQVTVPFDGTVVLRGTAFTGTSGNFQPLDSAVETWTLGDASIVSMSSSEGILGENGVLHCFNSSQVVLKPGKAGTTSIRIANDLSVIAANSNSPSVEIEIVVTGGPTTLTLTPDTLLTMNHHQINSVHALAQDANGVEVPIVVAWKISDTSVVDFTDAPDNNTTAISANSDPTAYRYIKALKPGTTQITAVVPGPNGTQLTQKMLVTVLPVLGSAVIEAPGSVLAGQEIRLQVRLLNSNGELVNDTKLHIPVIVPDDYINARLDPQDNTGRLLLVRGVKPGAGLLTLKYKNENGDEVKSSVGIRVVTVAAFRPVRVSLDMMDEETAGQLFGSRTSKEFYVVRVRLFNNLDQLGAEFLGQSILTYSESIEAAVTLQKRYDPKTKTKPLGPISTEWDKVDKVDVEGTFEREFENGDNTASGDKRFRGKPQVKFLTPPSREGQTDNTFRVAVGDPLNMADPLKAAGSKLNVADYLWKSANPSIATVNSDTGLVVGREPGLTFVRGTDVHDQEYIAIIQVKSKNDQATAENDSAPTVFPNVTARILPNLSLDVGQSAALAAFDDPSQSSSEFTMQDLPTDLSDLKKAIKALKPDTPFVKAVKAVQENDTSKDKGATSKKEETELQRALGKIQQFLTDSVALTKEDILSALNALLDSDLYLQADQNLLPAPYTTYTKDQLKRLGENPTRKRRLNRALIVKQFPKLLAPKEDGDLQWISLTEAVAAVVPQDGNTTLNSNIVTAKYPGTALLVAKRGNNVVYGMQIDVNQPRTNDLPPNVFIDDKGHLQYMRHRFRYRPYAFEMMINSIDARDEKEPRTRVFKAANALATIASFFTTTGILHGGKSSDIVNGFSNIIIPGFEKLYPSMKDTQRQNFVSMSMKPLEEIPFGADIARVLFFPKHSFHGIIPGYEVRIGEVVTSEFNVKVAIIDKTKAATVNAAGQ